MNRKKALIAVAIALLVVLNVWRWLPQQTPVAADTRGAADTGLAELQLRVANVDVATRPMRRDLFYRVAQAPRPGAQSANPARRVAAAPTPVKSPEQIALETAQAEFAAIRVIGIVFRDGRGQAYLQTEGKSELVGTGDTFGSFTVTAIRQDAVELRGIDTAAGGKIALAGS